MSVVNSVRAKFHAKEFHHITTIAVIFVSVLLISNIASTKILSFGPFDFDGGTLLFPLSYIFGDILTEVYGFSRTRRIIWLGFAMALMMGLVFWVVGALPASGDWGNQDAYLVILGSTPRIIFASVLAYGFGEFVNSYVLAKIKIAMHGKMLWVRTIASTILGEAFDTVIFVLVAFWGIFPTDLIIIIIVSNYIFKVLIEVLFTPFTYLLVNRLKKSEGIDIYDSGTNFNPFKL